MKAISKGVTVYDVYDRAKSGPKMEEKDWDFGVIPKTARALKKKYGIKMDKSVMIPEDEELIDKLFQAGISSSARGKRRTRWCPDPMTPRFTRLFRAGLPDLRVPRRCSFRFIRPTPRREL